jgi:RNA polymerase sigma-70 factor (ECF subfamily)
VRGELKIMEPRGSKGVKTDRPMEDLGDRELIALCQRGDRAAFETLVKRHHQHAFNIAYGMLRNYEDANEVAQDTFVRVHRAIGRFRGDSEFTTWMYRIVVNLARNYLRHGMRHGKGKHVSLDEPIDGTDGELKRELPSQADSADEIAAKEEHTARIMANVQKLPRKYREVLVMRFADQMSYDQISKVLRCSIGTVKSRIARARDGLRRRMELDPK